MKKLILSCLFLGLVACNASVNTTDNQKPKVISTSTIIADLTARVGGEEIDHQDILKPGDDPHVYEPVPADSVALEKADLIEKRFPYTICAVICLELLDNFVILYNLYLLTCPARSDSDQLQSEYNSSHRTL